MKKPVADWPFDDEYANAEEVAEAVAEPEAHGFLSSARKEDNLKKGLQVVENERKRIPKQRKRKAEYEKEKSWFLKLEN